MCSYLMLDGHSMVTLYYVISRHKIKYQYVCCNDNFDQTSLVNERFIM